MRGDKRKALYLIYLEAGALIVLLVVLIVSGVRGSVAEPQKKFDSSELHMFSNEDFEVPERSASTGEELPKEALDSIDRMLTASQGGESGSDVDETSENVPKEENSLLSSASNDGAGQNVTAIEGAEALQTGFAEEAREKCALMTLEEKVAQLFVVTPEDLMMTQGVTVAGNITRNCLEQYPVGGIVYSHSNYLGLEQIEALLGGANEISDQRIGVKLLILGNGVDREGKSILAVSRKSDPSALTGFLATEGYVTEYSNPKSFTLSSFPYSYNEEHAGNCVLISAESAKNITGEDIPCFISAETIAMLRQKAGEGCLIITEQMTDRSVGFERSLEESVVKAINCGADMVFVPEYFRSIYEKVLTAAKSGAISGEVLDTAVCRILTYKMQNTLE